MELFRYKIFQVVAYKKNFFSPRRIIRQIKMFCNPIYINTERIFVKSLNNVVDR